ncbi:uncharacterized protein LOC122238333 isoform X2 [Panthera tigris]|uniref:uncharacterized protein LOC122238333 isoform X2 n=1 Tax=Panthera tigris TaxID=9694 RepID=UPI001C6F9D9F|nr:uncharacterized protein LOC122238333 isoform X2 [Panthera tigris]
MGPGSCFQLVLSFAHFKSIFPPQLLALQASSSCISLTETLSQADTVEGKTKTQKEAEKADCTSPTLTCPGDEIPIILNNDHIIISNERNAVDPMKSSSLQFMRQSVEYFKGTLLQITDDVIEGGVTCCFAWEKIKRKEKVLFEVQMDLLSLRGSNTLLGGKKKFLPYKKLSLILYAGKTFWTLLGFTSPTECEETLLRNETPSYGSTWYHIQHRYLGETRSLGSQTRRSRTGFPEAPMQFWHGIRFPK